jgi:excisionase family DNA binding protein
MAKKKTTEVDLSELTLKEKYDRYSGQNGGGSENNEDEETAAGGTKYQSKKQAARSSVEVTAELADAAEVSEIQEAIGKLYTVEAVAAALGTTTRTVLQKLRDGKLKGVKIGGNWKIPIDALKKFVNAE